MTFTKKMLFGLVLAVILCGCSAPKKSTVKELSDLLPPGATNVEFVTAGAFVFEFNGDSWYAYLYPDGHIEYDKAPDFGNK